MIKTDDYEIDRLSAFEKQIFVKAKENIDSTVGTTQELLSMLYDLQEICETFREALKQRELELKNQKSINESLMERIEEQKIKIEKYESKAAYYEKMELDSAKIAALLIDRQQEQETLARERERLTEEKRAFEDEKSQLIAEKNTAVNNAKKYKDERDSAIRSRDEAMAEARILKGEIADKERIIEAKEREIIEKRKNEENVLISLEREIRTKVSILKEKEQISEEAEWLRGYAEALDKKIIRYFKDKEKKELKNHFKDYLDDPAKWEEHRKHFPEFEGTEKKKENEAEKNEMSDDPTEQQVENEMEPEMKPGVEKAHT